MGRGASLRGRCARIFAVLPKEISENPRMKSGHPLAGRIAKLRVLLKATELRTNGYFQTASEVVPLYEVKIDENQRQRWAKSSGL